MQEIKDIINGDKSVNFKVGIAEEDLQKAAIYIGAAIFISVLLANFLTKR
jgi:hypothetical protein